MADADRFVRPRRGGEPNPLLDMPELLEAALDEFSARSFDAASLNDVIKAAGMNKGSFYYRFADKLDLYLCMGDVILQRKLEHFAHRRSDAAFPDDVFEQLRVLAQAGLEFAHHEPRLYALSRRLLAEAGTIREAVRLAFPRASEDILHALLDAARAKGQFRPRFSSAFIKAVVGALTSNLDALITPETSDEELAGVLDDLIEMLRAGLAAEPGGSRLPAT